MTDDVRIVTLRQLRDLVRGTRLEQGLTQKVLAEKSGVSRKWLNEFERGNPNAQIRLVMAVLDALDVSLTVRSDPPPTSRAGGFDPIGDHIDRTTRAERDV